MSKTLKKTLSIILTVLMIATTIPFAFGAEAEYEIKPGERITITIPQDGEGSYVYIKVVTDVSGMHTFLSYSGEAGDPYAEFYDEDMNLINSDDDGKGDLNFKLQYELEAGKTYYLGVRDIQFDTEREWDVVLCNDVTHIGGTQTCKGYKCEICEAWYGEAGEHDLDSEQTCLGYYCYFCEEYCGEAGEHDLSNEQTCLGYYCYFCGDYYGEADPDAHNWNGTYCDICDEEHDHTGGTQTCKGFKCEVCESWYGEAGEQHDLSTEQTCKGYKCNLCYRYFGESGEHSSSTEQTCMGYWCEFCYEWFGEADTSKHGWSYGYCDYCDTEYPVDEECSHDLDYDGDCIICGYQCPHEVLENGTCTNCSYSLPFSLTTGETVTYHGSFPDAFYKAEDGSIIKLLRNYDDYNNVEINKAIILDLNGKEWIQPSSGGFDVTANATFTDSVGGGYLSYSLNLYSPVTISGGTYRYIGIHHETDDMIGDYLADCYACFDRYTDEIIDADNAEYVLGATIKFSHKLGEQTCRGYQCEDCGEYFGEADPDAHIWRFGECIVCEYVCEHSFTKYTEKKVPTCTEAGSEMAPCDYCDAVDVNEIPALEHNPTSHDCRGYYCSVCRSFYGEPTDHTLLEQICKGSWCTVCRKYYGEGNPDIHVDGYSSTGKRKDGCCDGCFKQLAIINSGETYEINSDAHFVEFVPALDGRYILTIDGPAGTEFYFGEVVDGAWNGLFCEVISDLTFALDCSAGKTYRFELIHLRGYTISSITLECETHSGTEQTCYGYVCDACGVYFGEALGHDIITDEAVAPTCTETGLTEGSHCTRCDDMTVVQEIIPVLDHIDNDGDYLCDHGCGHEFEQPVTPDEPTDDTCDRCGEVHTNFFQNFICMIRDFFNRIINFFTGLFK